MSDRAETLIRDWQTRLHANDLAARILATLDERKSEVERCALDGLQRENPQFERATSRQFREEALGHCNDILQLMLAIAEGRAARLGPDPFRFVQTHAVRRARQQFPLAGSLNAYRLAHKGYWEVMRNSVSNAKAAESEKTDCLMILSEFLLEFFDRVSGVMTDAYIAEEKLMIARSRRTHVALIEDLLHGRQPGDLEAQALSERCGISSGAPIAVAIARIGHSENERRSDGAGKLERLSDVFHRALSPLAFGRLIDIRKDEVLAILTAGAQTSKRVLGALGSIAAELKAELNDLARIGISLDATDISALPQAYQEAERAVEFANAERPILHFGDIDLMEFLVRRPDAAALRLIPDWAGRFMDVDSGRSGELTRTISQFADCNFNVKRTARHLDLHTNTVYFRLNRIRELTGIDPRSYAGLSLLLTTVRMLSTGARPESRSERR